MARKTRMRSYVDLLNSNGIEEKKAHEDKPGSVLARLKELRAESAKEAQSNG